jgi:hypothetical protein
VKWLTGRGPVPEPPFDDWTLEKRQKVNLLDLYNGDIQRAVTAWETYQQDLGKYGKDTRS